MKRKLYLLCAAACLISCAACGRRDEPVARYPETTVTITGRTARQTASRTTRQTEKRTTMRTTTRVGKDIRDMADDAAEGVSEMAGDAAERGRELMTDAAADVSEAVAVRKGDGDYHADDDGKVEESGR